MFYTYLWLREDGTPYYVGKGSGRRAFTSTAHGVFRPEQLNRILVQEQPCEVDAFEVEKFLICYYGRLDLGTGCLRNRTDGGDGASGYKYTEELRQIRRNHRHTPETRRKMKAVHTGHVGVHHTDETRQKISAVHKGKKVSEETRHRMSLARKAYWARRTA